VTIDLRVHVRRVVGADGSVTSENEVYCLRRQRTVPVAECEDCPEHGGACVDLRHHRNYVCCSGITPETVRGLAASRRPLLIRRPGVHGSRASSTAIGDVMTADVYCARADLPLPALARVFEERRIGCIPVVDGAGRPLGVVSPRDLLHTEPGARVGNVMTALLYVLPDNATVSEAAALMALERIHHLPIVTDDGKVAGIVSSLDVLGWLAREDGYLVAEG
jgi:CBS domain-containing protein